MNKIPCRLPSLCLQSHFVFHARHNRLQAIRRAHPKANVLERLLHCMVSQSHHWFETVIDEMWLSVRFYIIYFAVILLRQRFPVFFLCI